MPESDLANLRLRFTFNSQLEEAFHVLVEKLEQQSILVSQIQKELPKFSVKPELDDLRNYFEGELGKLKVELQAEFRAGIGPIQEHIRDIETSALQTKRKTDEALDTLKQAIQDHDRRLDGLSSVIERHNKRLDQHDTGILDKASRSALEDALQRLEAADKSLGTEINSLQGMMVTKAPASELAAAEGRIERRFGDLKHTLDASLHDFTTKIMLANEDMENLRKTHDDIKALFDKYKDGLDQCQGGISSITDRVELLEQHSTDVCTRTEAQRWANEVRMELTNKLDSHVTSLEGEQQHTATAVEVLDGSVHKLATFLASALGGDNKINLVEFRDRVYGELEKKANREDIPSRKDIEDDIKKLYGQMDRLTDRLEKAELLDTAALEQLVTNCNLLNTHLQTKADAHIVDNLERTVVRLETVLHDGASETCLICRRREPVVGLRSLIKHRPSSAITSHSHSHSANGNNMSHQQPPAHQHVTSTARGKSDSFSLGQSQQKSSVRNGISSDENGTIYSKRSSKRPGEGERELIQVSLENQDHTSSHHQHGDQDSNVKDAFPRRPLTKNTKNRYSGTMSTGK